MSGFMPSGTFQLTTKKMQYWHDGGNCPSKASCDIIAVHVLPAGFRVVGPYCELSGPGLAEGRTDELYEAISLRRSFNR
jgi:hypothetical protein